MADFVLVLRDIKSTFGFSMRWQVDDMYVMRLAIFSGPFAWARLLTRKTYVPSAHLAGAMWSYKNEEKRLVVATLNIISVDDSRKDFVNIRYLKAS